MTLALVQNIKNKINSQYERWLNARIERKGNRLVLGTRSVYVVPTRYGFIMACVLFLLLLVATNYSNSMAFMLTFLVASICLIGMYQTYGNMSQLEFKTTPVEPIFAGQNAVFSFVVTSLNNRSRFNIYLGEPEPTDSKKSHSEKTAKEFITQIPAHITEPNAPITFKTHPLPRGEYTLERTRIWSKYPLGLFFAWTWMRLDTKVMVYPEPKSLKSLAQQFGNEDGQASTHQTGDDEYAGIRKHQITDSPQRIAWKAVARTQTMLSKEFTGTADKNTWLRYDQLLDFSPEDRLSQLCQWILDCEDSHTPYGLVLPNIHIPLSSGESHKRQCLSALALYDLPPQTSKNRGK